METVPYYYDHINRYNSAINPSTVHVHNTALAQFFKRRLLQKAMGVFEWEMPENWAKNYFLYVLYCFGSVTILNTDKFGVIPQWGTPAGYDVFYRPRRAVITNPLFNKTYDLVIGEQCTLINLRPDYSGIMDIVDYYGDMMALCAETAGTNILNSKLSYVFTAKNKAAAESFKKLYDKVASGEPAVVQDEKLMNADGSSAWDAFSQNVGQNYIADKILIDLRKWETEFDTVLGIPNANTDKRERLVTDEVNANNTETEIMLDLWLECLQKSCQDASDMFGITLNVDWRIQPESGVTDGYSLDYGDVQSLS